MSSNRPARFDGTTYWLSREDGLTQVEDLHGNRINILEVGIFHSPTGAQVLFQRDSEDRIVRVFDDDKIELAYDYNERGDLTQFVDQDGSVWEYGYDDDHNLKSIIDPRGIEVLTTEFDEDGRLISTSDALGHTTRVTHDIENVREYVRDARGYP